MPRTSGFFVPPTVGTPGISQNRVHATGGVPSATRVSETDGTTVKTRHITPEDFGIPRAPTHALRGGDPAMNADILRRILHGEASYYRDLVLVNAAAALSAAGKAASFLDGVETAAQAIDPFVGAWSKFIRRICSGDR